MSCNPARKRATTCMDTGVDMDMDMHMHVDVDVDVDVDIGFKIIIMHVALRKAAQNHLSPARSSSHHSWMILGNHCS